MLRTDRIAIWIFIIAFALLVTSIRFVNYLDEIVAVSMLGLACLDSCLNRGAWRRYIPLWFLLAVMSFYAVYSLTAVRYAATKSILIDIIIESKPFMGLFVMLGIRPSLSGADKTLLRWIAVANIIVSFGILLCPMSVVEMLIQHVAYGGIFIFISAIVFMIASIRPDGRLSPTSKLALVIFGCMGLACGRSKFYVEFVTLLFFLFVYRPGMFRRVTLKQMAMVGAMMALVMVVAWNKFSYYFLGGMAGPDSFDPDTIASYARPVLYATSFLIFAQHFPFGTGLASFASYQSIDPYSGVYAEYGIDKVYGLSASYPAFICDAYYPSLAQYGVAGLALFIWLIAFIIRVLGRLTRIGGTSYRYLYGAGMLALTFILVESTTGSAMVNSGGVMASTIIGIIGGRALNLSPQPSE